MVSTDEICAKLIYLYCIFQIEKLEGDLKQEKVIKEEAINKLVQVMTVKGDKKNKISSLKSLISKGSSDKR